MSAFDDIQRDHNASVKRDTTGEEYISCWYQADFAQYVEAANESSRKELEVLSICELATMNPSVKEYAEHWEDRTLKAEKELEAAKQRIAELEDDNRMLAGGINGQSQILDNCLAEKEALEKKLAEQQAIILKLLPQYGDVGTKDVEVAALRKAYEQPEELTNLLAAARQQGFEEGKQAAS